MKAILRYKQQESAIIAFDLTQDDGVKSILGNGNGWVEPDELHMTLLYLGDTSELDKDLVLQKLALLSTQQAPIEGEFTGYGIFNPSEHSGDKTPVVLLYDSPQLPVLHDVLRDVFDDEREPTHGFIPHVTVAYVNELSDFQKYEEPKVFDQISLWWGEEHYTYNLSGTIVEKGGPGSGHHGHRGLSGVHGGSLPGLGVGSSYEFRKKYRSYDAESEFIRRSDTWTKRSLISHDDRRTLAYYSDDGYQEINSYLRVGSVGSDEIRGATVSRESVMKESISEIDEMMAFHNTPENIMLYRKTTLGTVGELKVGDIFRDNAYTSTTLNRDHFYAPNSTLPSLEGGNSVIMSIGVPKGYPSLALYRYSNFPDEFEVLLDRDTIFKVIDIDGDSLQVEVIP